MSKRDHVTNIKCVHHTRNITNYSRYYSSYSDLANLLDFAFLRLFLSGFKTKDVYLNLKFAFPSRNVPRERKKGKGIWNVRD